MAVPLFVLFAYCFLLIAFLLIIVGTAFIAAAGEVEVNVLEQVPDPEEAGEHKEHPERVEEHQKDDQKPEVILVEQEPFGERSLLYIRGDIDGVDGEREEQDKSHDQDHFKKEHIKMPHEPLVGAVVPLADPVRKIVE